ncbi:DUF4838 domain-containing protein [Paenibacillus cymbidii]|uniref:DUF4838 domain-containing protein n=1 Tax=Paenibacillus cymbidii TaxID=1639034 RepID=UPI0010816A7D|nr:DUF4838 domain-containing protein [Paenibacillus cymbidii]
MIDKRGIVLNFDDLHDGWSELLVEAGINLIGLHNMGKLPHERLHELIAFVHSAAGRKWLDYFAAHGIDVEYEIHAMSWLLPRDRFADHPEWFRMDDRGERTPDANCCPSNEEAIAIIQRNSIELARQLPPTTHRYFIWMDDNKPCCRCGLCAGLSSSDQTLLVMNRILEAIRTVDPQATLAYLAYTDTLKTLPQAVKPAEGIFLELTGPSINNMNDARLQKMNDNPEHRQRVDQFLALFGAENAHVLEYWLDVSMQAKWVKPVPELLFDRRQMEEEVAFYTSRGIRSITSFGVFLDEQYFRDHGNPPIAAYGAVLQGR